MISPSIFPIVIICLVQSSSFSSPTDIRTTSNSHIHTDSHRDNDNKRNLQAFSTLNSILSEFTLVLPDSDVSSNGLDTSITDLLCYGVTVQDVRVTRSSPSDTVDRVAVNAVGLSLTCNFRWSYQWSVLSVVGGSGSGKAVLDPSSGASLNLDITSGRPPGDVSVVGCVVNVQIGDLILDGDGLGAIASIINLFKTLLMGMIEEEVNTVVCSRINELGDGALLFVVQSNEKRTATYETGDISNSSSGAGWLVLFILLIALYSVGCYFCGLFCAGRARSYILLKETGSKHVKGDDGNERDNSNLAEVIQDDELDITNLRAFESAEVDVEGQSRTDEVGEATNTTSISNTSTRERIGVDDV